MPKISLGWQKGWATIYATYNSKNASDYSIEILKVLTVFHNIIR